MRTRLRILLAGVLGALSLVVLSPGPAFACSCVMADTAQHVAWADVVVTGTVVDQTGREGARSSLAPVTLTVDVHEVFKGSSGRLLEVTTAAHGASCGLEGVRPGGRYVLFASPAAGGLGREDAPPGTLWANLCGGTAPATPRLVAEVEAVTGPGQPPGPGTTGTAGSGPAGPQRPDEPAKPVDDTVLTGGGSGGGTSSSTPVAVPATVLGATTLAGVALLVGLRRRRHA